MDVPSTGDPGSRRAPGAHQLSFLARTVSPRFHRRVLVLAAGESLPYVRPEWCDALVVVERGELELVAVRGGRCRFVAGDVLCLAGLPVTALHNPGRRPATLAIVSRARDMGHMTRSTDVHPDD